MIYEWGVAAGGSPGLGKIGRGGGRSGGGSGLSLDGWVGVEEEEGFANKGRAAAFAYLIEAMNQGWSRGQLTTSIRVY